MDKDKNVPTSNHLVPYIVVSVLIVTVLAGLPWFISGCRHDADAKRVSAETATKQEIYVNTVNFDGYDNEGLLVLGATEKWEGTFRRAKPGAFPVHVFEISSENIVKYRVFGDKNWRELSFDNSKTLGKFVDVLREYGEDVGACHDTVRKDCTVFLF